MIKSNIMNIKEHLEKFQEEIQEPITQFNQNINNPNSSIPQVSCYMAAILYEYKRLETKAQKRAASPDPRCKTPEMRANLLLTFIEKNFSPSQIQEILNSFSTNDQAALQSAPRTITQLIPQIKNIATPVLKEIDSLKRTLQELYLNHNIPFLHISPVDIQDGHINPSKNIENQPENEIVTGVFATSSYSNMISYMACSVAGSMIVNNTSIQYPQNPFAPLQEQTNASKIKLARPVYAYALSPEDFEPQFHFEPKRKEGFTISFCDEWVKHTDVPLPFYSSEIISEVDSEPFLTRNTQYIDKTDRRLISFSKCFSRKFDISLPSKKEKPDKEV